MSPQLLHIIPVRHDSIRQRVLEVNRARHWAVTLRQLMVMVQEGQGGGGEEMSRRNITGITGYIDDHSKINGSSRTSMPTARETATATAAATTKRHNNNNNNNNNNNTTTTPLTTSKILKAHISLCRPLARFLHGSVAHEHSLVLANTQKHKKQA